jgi:hypothetical protein
LDLHEWVMQPLSVSSFLSWVMPRKRNPREIRARCGSVQNLDCAFDSPDCLRDNDEATHGGTWTRRVSYNAATRWGGGTWLGKVQPTVATWQHTYDMIRSMHKISICVACRWLGQIKVIAQPNYESVPPPPGKITSINLRRVARRKRGRLGRWDRKFGSIPCRRIELVEWLVESLYL